MHDTRVLHVLCAVTLSLSLHFYFPCNQVPAVFFPLLLYAAIAVPSSQPATFFGDDGQSAKDSGLCSWSYGTVF